MKITLDVDCDGICRNCPLSGDRDNCLKWRYADEAEKLISILEREIKDIHDKEDK